MSIDWNLYLFRYQQTHGGIFFGACEDKCDCQLVLSEGEKTPLLVVFSTDPAGRYISYHLRAKTTVQLDGSYELYIRPQSLVGSGVQTVMGAVKLETDFGYPEVTRGRVITTDNKPFTKLVLGDLELRNALTAQTAHYVKVRPAPKKQGLHLVEVGPAVIGRAPWVNDILKKDISFMSPEDKEVVERVGSKSFDAQLDELLNLLRAAQNALTVWRLNASFS
jgi:hypothetical protein